MSRVQSVPGRAPETMVSTSSTAVASALLPPGSIVSQSTFPPRADRTSTAWSTTWV